MGKRANGEGSIYKYKKGYAAQITVAGKKRKTFYGKTKDEVAAKLRYALVEKHEGRLSSEPSQPLGDYLTAWLQNVEGTVRPSTYGSYRLNVRRITTHLGTVKLNAVKPAHVKQLHTDLEREKLAPRSILQAHRVLHRAMRDAMQWELVQRNPCQAVKGPHAGHSEMQTLTAEQVQRLFDASEDDRFHVLWVLLTTTGLRLGEALGLKWSDIDMDGRGLMVRRTLQRVRAGGGLQFLDVKSKTSRRTVRLSRVAIQALKAQEERLKFDEKKARGGWIDHDLVFPSTVGTPLEVGRVHKHFKATLKAASLPNIRIHDLRHTAATLMLQQGIHPKVVQEMLGHSSITLTLGTYSHVLPTMHEEVADRMDTLFSGVRREAPVLAT